MNEMHHDFKPIISDIAKITGKGHIQIGAFTVIEDYVLLDTANNLNSYIIMGKRCKIKQGAILRTYNGGIKLGNRVSIGEYTQIAGHGGVTIGDCTIIAGQCYITAANHIYIDNELIRFQGETAKGVNIGNNVWVGGDVMIMDGVTIGVGCVIGAGSVVTEDLPSDTICYGVPCKVVREREKPQWLTNNMMGGD